MTYSRHWIAISLALSLFLTGYVILSPSELPKLHQLKIKEAELKKQIVLTQNNLDNLIQEITLLRGRDEVSKNYLERLIREELGFIRSNEQLYVFDSKRGELERLDHNSKKQHLNN